MVMAEPQKSPFHNFHFFIYYLRSIDTTPTVTAHTKVNIGKSMMIFIDREEIQRVNT